MRLVLASVAALTLFGAAAIAQTTTQGSGSTMTQPGSSNTNSGTSNPAVNVKPAGSPESTGAVAPGANSFTEGQARSRIEAQGYSNISELKKDEQGMWRGRAMRNGSSVNVMLDFKGNVATQ